jgi:hypothetical protein
VTLYCASCGLDMTPEIHVYQSSTGHWLHEEADGTAACGPVLQKLPVLATLALPPMRMQVTVTAPDGRTTLVAEVVAPFEAFSAFQPYGGYWERWVRARVAAGKPAGGAAIQRADLPRVWNVPVGSTWR